MTKPLRFLPVLMLGCGILLSACSKKETVGVDNETQSAVDYAIADQEFMSLVSMFCQDALKHPVTTLPNYTYPVYSSERNMPDGKERSGSLNVWATGTANQPGTQMVLKMVNYSASGISYSCDSMVVITNASDTTKTSFSIKLINGTCKGPDYSIKHRFDRTFTIYPGHNVDDSDGLAYVYGGASGTNRVNRNYSASVSQATSLVKHINCPYINSGRMDLTPEGFKTRIVDFGNGTCDDEATFTVNENTVAFRLK